MSRSLIVAHESRRVGILTQDAFTYSRDWIEVGFPISASLPLRPEAHQRSGLAWFANLLPEGGTRERIARRLRLSPDDDFGLLEALGRDCAGALTIASEEGTRQPLRPRYQRLSEAQLVSVVDDVTRLPLLHEEGRLSLAGAQNKLPVHVDESELDLPLDGAPSSHILKLPNRDFGNLVENELLCLRLANAVGLPSAQASALYIGKTPALLVERYDRETTAEGRLRRLHQEDFVQALGMTRYQKYEHDQGVTFAQCGELLRSTAARPALELRILLRWLFFNLAIGNRDNHGKNLSRLLSEGDSPRWRLAPFYDLVNTTGYKTLSRSLAFSIGGVDRVERLRAPQWEQFARTMNLPVRFVLDECRQTIDHIETELEGTRRAVAEELKNDAHLAAPTRAIKKALRATRESVA